MFILVLNPSTQCQSLVTELLRLGCKGRNALGGCMQPLLAYSPKSVALPRAPFTDSSQKPPIHFLLSFPEAQMNFSRWESPSADSSEMFTFASPSYAILFCVSGCCESPFHATAQMCHCIHGRRAGSKAEKYPGHAQTSLWGSAFGVVSRDLGMPFKLDVWMCSAPR